MDTKIFMYRSHVDAYCEFSMAAKENITNKRFRMYLTSLSFDCNGVKYIFASMDEIGSTALPEGEHVSLHMRCLITEEERLMLTRQWRIV